MRGDSLLNAASDNAMNGYQRIHRLLEGKPVDRIPVVPIFMAWSAEYAGFTYRRFQLDHRVMAECVLRTQERFGFDQISVISDPYRETHDYGARIEYRDHGVGKMIEPLMASPADVRKLRRMKIEETTRMLDRAKGVEPLARARKGELSILGWLEGPMAEFATLCTTEAALVFALTEPEFFNDACAVIVDNAIEWGRAQIEAGADMIGVGDAAASLLSPQLYRDLVLPWEKKLFSAIHAAGAPVRLHICGNVNHIVEDMAASGADAIDVDWMVDLPRTRRLIGPDIALFGQFDPSAVLRWGTPQAVAAHARKNIAEGGAKFGLMPGCEVPPQTPEANIEAFCPCEGCLIADALARPH